MTNKQFMCTLDTESFETAMYTLYFVPKLWVKGNDAEKHSTPNMFEIRKWLDMPYKADSEFWKYVTK